MPERLRRRANTLDLLPNAKENKQIFSMDEIFDSLNAVTCSTAQEDRCVLIKFVVLCNNCKL